VQAPHPIPYQGSKRRLVPVLLACAPARFRVMVEPFVGSGALTLGAALHGRGERYLVGDSLEPLARLWALIVARPQQLADRYERVWRGQLEDPRRHYGEVRAAFNLDKDPAKLLYLLARCVKNAVRFNPRGGFNQSADHRRTGMLPAKMRREIAGAHRLLAGRAEAVHADYRELLARAGTSDLVFMDPPYQGVSRGRDGRYFESLDLERFVAEIDRLNARAIRFMFTFDGRTGGRTYGGALPRALGLRRIALHTGRSSQATLSGRTDETVESLYLSPALAKDVPDVPRVVRLRPAPRRPTAAVPGSG